MVTRFGCYEGAFQDNYRKGKGTFEWKNGDVYNGMWDRNFMHGVGKYVSHTDNIYTGEWVYGVRQGKELN